MTKKRNNPGEDRYSVTHAFELKTAETLGTFNEQLRQHTTQISNIDSSIKAWDVRFTKLEAGLESIRIAINGLQNPSVRWRTLGKYAITIMTSGSVLAYVWNYITRLGL